jgi:multiple sugar transport system substrate-binding protein
MKYMDPVLEDADKRAEFSGKFGYELDPYGWYKNKLWTWQKVRDVAEFFTGWDWNNDGEPDYGALMGLRVGEQGPFWFYPFAAPFVTSYGPTKDRYHNVFWFDPETMDPLVKTPGFVEAATVFKDLLQFMPEAALTFTFADKWDYFLNKEKAMLLWAAPDTFTLAGMPDQSQMRGYCMTMPGPGSEKYWDLENERWVEQINQVGNAAGCSWHGWVSTMSKNPEATYWVLAYLSRPDNHRDITSSKMYWTGYDPGFISDVLTDYGGTATLADFNLPGGFVDPGYTTALYNEGDLRRAHLAVYNNFFAMDAVQDYMRLIGGTAMFTATDTHVIGEMMAGGESPETVLDRTYNDWTKTIDDLDREKMKKWYQDMIGYGKPNPYVPQPWRFDVSAFPKDLIFS